MQLQKLDPDKVRDFEKGFKGDKPKPDASPKPDKTDKPDKDKSDKPNRRQ